jgi:hypothetical protein
VDPVDKPKQLAHRLHKRNCCSEEPDTSSAT